ncbi:tetratricopeptide repeat protein [Acanthopleuribacter pedis]|uniref:Tetratricopeptide repeat protein n=1 Tax=Acanthopleuribacter pedis TaxID=442870 RepID=A0A8J7QBB7_9BACT|nr:tetratricopeptide repeat protein [Acanthopleuribacter pedis]MBO1322411.1 tetratricopeptide repeat protein [Acanthopleuribacter pedis]
MGPEHIDTPRAKGMQARLLGQLGRTQKATRIMEQVFAANEKRLGFEQRSTLISANGLASAYMHDGRPAAAVASARTISIP